MNYLFIQLIDEKKINLRLGCHEKNTFQNKIFYILYMPTYN